jgi:hypothetical protein
VPDVVVRLEREKAERFVERHLGNPAAPWSAKDLADVLRAALDSPPVEERIIYRVAGSYRRGSEDKWWSSPTLLLDNAYVTLKRCADLEQTCNVRIQSRTITTFSDGSELISPWTDLPSEEGER